MDLLLLMAIAEYIEIYWQKGDSLRSLLLFNQQSYNNSPAIYLLKHTGFILVLFIIFALGLVNMFTLSILVMKVVDLSFKLSIINKLNNEGEVYLDRLLNGGDFQISSKVRYSNIVIYPLLLFLGLL
jgi:hypothetical protein